MEGRSQVMEDFVEWVKVSEFKFKYTEKLFKKKKKSEMIRFVFLNDYSVVFLEIY